MQFIKRGVSLLLASCMIFSMVGCNMIEKPKEMDVGVDAVSKQGDVSNTITDLRDELYPVFDMGGRTIRIIQGNPFLRYESTDDDIYDKPEMLNSFSEEQAQLQLDNLRRIEKKYNVRIDMIEESDYMLQNNLKNTTQAGKPSMDIYAVRLKYVVPMLASGIALPISEYALATSDIANDRKFMQSIETFGEEYLFSEKFFSYYNGPVLVYNKKIIQDLGLEEPRSLYEKGEWTWEIFAEYAKSATKDYDGDRIVDRYGYNGNFSNDMSFVYSNNGIIANSEKEGLSSSNVVEAFQFLNKLYQEDKSVYVYDENKPSLLNSISIFEDILFIGSYGLSHVDHMQMNNINMDWGIVPYPLGPKGDGSMYGHCQGNWLLIPSGVEKPDKVYQIYEEYVNWFNFDLTATKRVFKEHPNYDYENVSQVDKNLVQELGQKTVFDYSNFLPNNIVKEYYDSIINNQHSVEEATETYKVKLQEEIDSMFRKYN